jgi:cytochrome b561
MDSRAPRRARHDLHPPRTAMPLPPHAVPPSPRHPRPLIASHWATVLLLLAVFGLALARELVEDKATRDALLQWHRQCGLAAGLLTLLRLQLRTRWPLAPTGEAAGAWQQRAAWAVHVLMYALLLALPLLGWLLTNARGQGVRLPLLGALPVLLQRDLDLADQLEDWHGAAGWALAALVALHMAAALWHHWVRRDRVLAAMWPGLRPRG